MITLLSICCQFLQAFSGVDREIAKVAKLTGNTALDAALNAQFLVQIGVFTAVPMIMGFILELGLLKVSLYVFNAVYVAPYNCIASCILLCAFLQLFFFFF